MGGGAFGVEVLSRKVVGSYDAAVVRETAAGSLNAWLERENYRRIEGGDGLIVRYREKGYVFVCIKVSDAALSTADEIDLHPLRFRFATGGRDGAFFPMRLTGLQTGNFDVNLYVFHRARLVVGQNRDGFTHRGCVLHYEDGDGPDCVFNAGKAWSAPRQDPFLREASAKIGHVATFLHKHHFDRRFYLTNLRATDFDPQKVREWPDDLWLFPRCADPRQIPFEAQPGGPASEG